jgi:protein ImuB
LQIAALNPAAAASELRLGMTLADARVWLPSLKVAEIDRVADSQLLLGLAAACERYTPLIALDGAEGLHLDITGCAHLFGGEAALHGHICQRFLRAGLTTHAAIAGTPDAARAAVRFGRSAILPPGAEAQAARALPVAALEQDAATTLALVRAGLKTLGDLVDRPAYMLAARFGARLVTALRRITGQEDTRLTPLRPAPDCQATRIFPEPMLDMPAIEAVMAELAEAICRMLAERGQGGRRFEAGFFRGDGTVRRIVIDTATACRSPATILRLMRLKLDTLADPVDPGYGFDAFRLGVLQAEPLSDRQIALDGSAEAEADVAALVDRLVARFGRGQVQRFLGRDSHDPQRSAVRVPVASDAASHPWPVPEPGNPPARPLTLFTPPQLIEALAEVPDGPPLRFRWRRMLHDVARAEGPERIAPEWWAEGNCAPSTRDYYRIEDSRGHRFWVFREGLFEEFNARPRWFLHGLFA